jgi:hypothetical protein
MAEEDRLVDADVIARDLSVKRDEVLMFARQGLIPVIRFSRKLIRFNRARVRAAVDQLAINAKRRRSLGMGGWAAVTPFL